MELGGGELRSPPRPDVLSLCAAIVVSPSALVPPLPCIRRKLAVTGLRATLLLIVHDANAAGDLRPSAASASGASTALPPGQCGPSRRLGSIFLILALAAARTSSRPPPTTRRGMPGSLSQPKGPRCTPAAATRLALPPLRKFEGGAIRLGRSSTSLTRLALPPLRKFEGGAIRLGRSSTSFRAGARAITAVARGTARRKRDSLRATPTSQHLSLTTPSACGAVTSKAIDLSNNRRPSAWRR